MKLIIGVLALFVVLPIWFFLMYRILTAVQATELMWFLYWLYVPVTVLVHTISEIAKGDKKL